MMKRPLSSHRPFGPIVKSRDDDTGILDNGQLTRNATKELKELRRIGARNPRITDDFIQKANELGLVVTGEGASRIVVENLSDNRVIKLSKNNHNLNKNEIETRSYYKIKDEVIAKHVMPILDFSPGFEIIVQRRANEIGAPKEDIIKLARKFIYDYGYVVDDMSPENVGKRGRTVVIDYGEGIHTIEESQYTTKDEAFNTTAEFIEDVYN